MTPDAVVLVSAIREVFERAEPWTRILSLLLDHMRLSEPELADEIAREMQTAALTGAWSGAHRGWTPVRLEKDKLEALSEKLEALEAQTAQEDQR